MVHPMEAETIRILDQEMGFNFSPYALSLEELREKEAQGNDYDYEEEN